MENENGKETKTWKTLSREDWSSLMSIANGKHGGISLWSSKRLRNAGFIDSRGSLTNLGKEKVDAINKVLERLRKGIPFHLRKERRPMAILKKSSHWFSMHLAGKTMLTDGAILFLGQPWKRMKKGLRPAPVEYRRRIKEIIVAVTSKEKDKYVEVFPAVFHRETYDDVGRIWLEDKEGDVRVAVDAAYFDFLMDRFKNCKTHAAGSDLPVKFLAEGRGVSREGIIALVMPLKFMPG